MSSRQIWSQGLQIFLSPVALCNNMLWLILWITLFDSSDRESSCPMGVKHCHGNESRDRSSSFRFRCEEVTAHVPPTRKQQQQRWQQLARIQDVYALAVGDVVSFRAPRRSNVGVGLFPISVTSNTKIPDPPLVLLVGCGQVRTALLPGPSPPGAGPFPGLRGSGGGIT